MSDSGPKREGAAAAQIQSGPDVTLYRKAGCHLCDEAKAAIAPLLQEFRATLREIDIEGEAALMEHFGCDIPVIYIGRKKAAKHRVNLEQFRRQLQDAS
jgi:glutaredoxin